MSSGHASINDEFLDRNIRVTIRKCITRHLKNMELEPRSRDRTSCDCHSGSNNSSCRINRSGHVGNITEIRTVLRIRCMSRSQNVFVLYLQLIDLGGVM